MTFCGNMIKNRQLGEIFQLLRLIGVDVKKQM